MKKILILGASGGIGCAISADLKQRGFDVFVSSRTLDNLLTTLKTLSLTNEKGLIADISSTLDLEKIADLVRTKNIDTVINATGSNHFAALNQQRNSEIKELLELNLTSSILLTRDLVEVFKDQGQGTLIHVGSALGAIGLPGYSTYCASKFGLRGFCQSLSRELADTEIKIRYFSPRATDTKLNTNSVNKMNQELGVRCDSSEFVAKEFGKFITSKVDSYQVGWPEKLFVRLNGLYPELVSRTIKKQLSTYKKYLEQT